jgi:hypothetical protein
MVFPGFAQTVLFEDDFESYATGTHPAPWVVRYIGFSGAISEDVAVSGDKSFKLVSYPLWARVEAIPLATIPDHIVYEGSVYVNETTKGGVIGFGFTDPPASYFGRNFIQFRSDAQIMFGGMLPHILQPYSAETWYKVKVYCDYVQLLAKVWIDDVLMLEDAPLQPREILEDFCIYGDNFSGGGTSTLYYDDIILYDATIPPDISVMVSPEFLWPPNHKMATINALVTVTDPIDPDPLVILESITSNEPDDAPGSGDGNTVDDIQDAEFGTEDYEFLLRAERSGKGDGRIYTITYRVTNFTGNTSTGTATVTVPHDKGKGKNKSLASMGEETESATLSNYPNPFNPTTKINYELPSTNYVDLNIYNALGQKVATLVSERQAAGSYQVKWDASGFASGTYYYLLQAGEVQQIRKMILLR